MSSSGSNASSVDTSSSGVASSSGPPPILYGNLAVYLDSDNYKLGSGVDINSFDQVLVDGVPVIVNPSGATDADKQRVDCVSSVNGNGVRVLTASVPVPVGHYQEIKLVPSALASPSRLHIRQIADANTVDIVENQTTYFLGRDAATPAIFAVNLGGGGAGGLEGCWQRTSNGTSQYLQMVEETDPCMVNKGWSWFENQMGVSVNGFALRAFLCASEVQDGAGGVSQSALEISYVGASQTAPATYSPPAAKVKQHPGPC
jgi:hypothetical protein